MKMKGFAFATIAAAGSAAVIFGLAPAASATPTEVGSAQDTIQSLQAKGYTVIVNRVGSAPLSKCTVGAVKPGHTLSRTDSGTPGAMGDLTTTVTSRTIYVYVSC